MKEEIKWEDILNLENRIKSDIRELTKDKRTNRRYIFEIFDSRNTNEIFRLLNHIIKNHILHMRENYIIDKIVDVYDEDYPMDYDALKEMKHHVELNLPNKNILVKNIKYVDDIKINQILLQFIIEYTIKNFVRETYYAYEFSEYHWGKHLKEDNYDFLNVTYNKNSISKIATLVLLDTLKDAFFSKYFFENNPMMKFMISNEYEFKQYRKDVDRLTKKKREKLFEHWNGYDYYDDEYISPYLNEKSSNPNYPTVDHKQSVKYCYENNIPAEECAAYENLVITKRSINSSKNSKCEDEYKKI